jgi:ubiquinone/menaquinone biosynthesis C-methylase UbiE
MSSKKEVEAVFTKTVTDWAGYYSGAVLPTTLQVQNLVSRKRFALTLLESSVHRGAKVLDVGCGTGDLVGELIQRGYNAWGLDLSEAMIRYARERHGRERFRVGDIEHIDSADNTFDAIMCLGVMEYLNKDEPALREIWRVLKPNGKAIITTPSVSCPFYHMDRLFGALISAARPIYRLLRYRLGEPARIHQTVPDLVHRRYFRRRWLHLLYSLHLQPEDWLCHSWGWYTLEPFFNQGALCRASDRFARNPMLNWLASDQLVRVRAVK